MQSIRWRRICQALCAALTNSYWFSLVSRTIYQGPLKGFCVPALNCYACPLAVSACPIGTIQYFLAHGAYYITLYTIGILGITGALIGRMACGWICPFGLLQDLLHKIRSRKFSLPRWLSCGKYAALGILVLAIPFLTKQPWFCKLCPAGGLEGAVPMLILEPSLRELLGGMFVLKVLIVVFFLAAMVAVKRPFCRAACPLGAIFSFFNRASVLRLSVDQTKCTKCNKCNKVCPTDIKVYEDPNAADCIRCLDCKDVCPENAVSYTLAGFPIREPKEILQND
ncbi:MAG TPA: 4Fe-4S binding protein [Sedimentisphaerales bacterium]|nr:4Fe-4S binding protein [Sedimentisphaerales bacterium]